MATKTPIDQGMIAPIAGGIKDMTAGWFAPMQPMQPVAPEDVRGRQFDFQPGYNLTPRPRQNEPITFEQLRALADNLDLLRLVIETRKDLVCKMDFEIKPVNGDDISDARCKEVRDFLRYPDKEHSWDTWLRMLLEDLFVIDAPAIYPRKTKGGGLYALEPMDGATIKRVIDNTGRTPLPPEPAYQQILKGMPAVNYTREELIYKPRNLRTSRVYGLSPVEQIIMTVNIALRRQLSQLQYYTDGSTPDLIMGVPDTWNPDQIKMFKGWWDETLAGNTGARRGTMFVPNGLNPINTKEGMLKDEFDDWLCRIICYAFSITPQNLIKQQNRATAQSSSETAHEEGLEPIMQWVKGVIDYIIAHYFGYTDLEFAWREVRSPDPLEQAQIDQIYLTTGVIMDDEVRDRLGLDPLTPEQRAQQAAAKMTAMQNAVGDAAPEEDKTETEKIEKFNPYNDEKGRFTSGENATFVSTTNAKTTAAMREAHAQGKSVGKQPESAPAVQSGHERLHQPQQIVRETDKAVAVHNAAYAEAKETARYDVKELSSKQIETLRSGNSLTWLPKSQVSISGGQVHGMAGWLAEKNGMSTHEGQARAAQRESNRQAAFNAGKERYASLLQQAKDAGVKGVRTGMRASTIRERMAAHGVTASKFEDSEFFKFDDYEGQDTLEQFEAENLVLQKSLKKVRVTPINRQRKTVTQARARLQSSIEAMLKKLGRVAGKQITQAYSRIAKEDRQTDIDAILSELTLQWDDVAKDVYAVISEVAKDSADLSVAQVMVDRDVTKALDLANAGAEQYAKDRAAEMIGMKYEGEILMPNPDARWRIDESTREMLRGDVTRAMDEGWSNSKLSAEIEDNYAFSPERASMIARTETAMADVQGSMTAYKAAEQSGVSVRKEWVTAEDDLVSEDCEANGKAGDLPLDAAFPSGADAPPDHPNCRCDIVPVVFEGLIAAEDDGE